MTIKLATLGLSLTLVTMSLGTTSAFAKCSKGFFADALCQVGVINKQTANAADQVHAGLGRPLDHFANQVAGAAADAVVPGSGTYVTQGLEMRDRFNRSGFNQGGGFNQGSEYQPASQTVPLPSQSPFGNFCATPYGTAAMAPSPIGYQCIVPTYYGPVAGVVVQ